MLDDDTSDRNQITDSQLVHELLTDDLDAAPRLTRVLAEPADPPRPVVPRLEPHHDALDCHRLAIEHRGEAFVRGGVVSLAGVRELDVPDRDRGEPSKRTQTQEHKTPHRLPRGERGLGCLVWGKKVLRWRAFSRLLKKVFIC